MKLFSVRVSRIVARKLVFAVRGGTRAERHLRRSRRKPRESAGVRRRSALVRKTRIGRRVGLPAICCAAAAGAQELSVERALQLLRESPRLQELQAGYAALQAKELDGGTRPGPTVSVSLEGAGRTDFYAVEQEIVMPGRNRLSRRARESAVAAGKAATVHDSFQTEVRMLHAFYRLVHAQERRDAIDRGIRELTEISRAVREFHASGRASNADLFLAEDALAEHGAAWSEAEIMIVRSRGLLAGLLGGRVDAETVRALGTLEPRDALPPLQEALAAALQARGDFQAATSRLEQLRLEAEAASRRRVSNPRVTGGVKRADLGNNYYAAGPFFAVTMPLPIPGRKRPAGVEESRVREAREHLQGLRHRILAEVRTAHHVLRIRRQAAEDYRTRSRTPALELRASALRAYRQGAGVAQNLLTVIRAAQDSALRLLGLQKEAKLAEIDFDRAAARDPMQRR